MNIIRNYHDNTLEIALEGRLDTDSMDHEITEEEQEQAEEEQN